MKMNLSVSVRTRSTSTPILPPPASKTENHQQKLFSHIDRTRSDRQCCSLLSAPALLSPDTPSLWNTQSALSTLWRISVKTRTLIQQDKNAWVSPDMTSQSAYSNTAIIHENAKKARESTSVPTPNHSTSRMPLGCAPYADVALLSQPWFLTKTLPFFLNIWNLRSKTLVPSSIIQNPVPQKAQPVNVAVSTLPQERKRVGEDVDAKDLPICFVSI